MGGYIGAEYDIPSVSGLSINGNVNYHTRQYVNKENTHSIPSWTTVDVGSAYKTTVSIPCNIEAKHQ
ncbi:hypothetical protein AB6F62_08005 [Providencia huaxiensis]|uniref:hypothetical protein n=1 Tax=Providencia huaxiensis TaxID=2027290 RepID=UPI0034DD4128